MNGTVKKIFKDKEFGFITPESGADAYFAKEANKEVFDTLNENDKVTFDVGQGPRGPVATNIALAA